MDADHDSAAAMIRSLPVVVPLSAKGYSTDRDNADADEAHDLLRDLFGT